MQSSTTIGYQSVKLIPTIFYPPEVFQTIIQKAENFSLHNVWLLFVWGARTNWIHRKDGLKAEGDWRANQNNWSLRLFIDCHKRKLNLFREMIIVVRSSWCEAIALQSQDRLRWRNYFTNCSTCERSFAFFPFSGKRKIHFPAFSYQKISSLSANAIQFLLLSMCEFSESFICTRLNFGTGLITLKVSKQFWTLIAQLVWSWKSCLTFIWKLSFFVDFSSNQNCEWTVIWPSLEAKEVFRIFCLFSNPKSISPTFWS